MCDACAKWPTVLLLLALVLPVHAEPKSAQPHASSATLEHDARSTAALLRSEVPDDAPGIAIARPTAPPHVDAFPSVQVNVDAVGNNLVGDAANEPSIAVDPLHPNRIVIGWRQFNTVLSNFRQAGVAYSSNGGRTWTATTLTPGVFRSDPVLAADSRGTFYYNSLRSSGGTLLCDVFRSTDGGVSWSAPLFAQGGDKAWMVLDRSGSVSDGNLYEAWSTAAGCCGTNTFTRSTDGGFTYDTPSMIPRTPIWGTMDVAPDGTLYLCGVDPSNFGRFLMASSTSARDRNSATSFEFSTTVNLGGTVSVQQGPTSPNPVGLLGQVWGAIDASSGPTAGWLYMLCSVDPPGPDPLDVHFVRSEDGGSTWSTPVRVNDDVGDDAWQWFGTMSVAPDGRIDVIWNDTRNSGVAQVSELYYAYSHDGGQTWSQNQKQSVAWNSHWGFPNQDKIGDYYHMVSDRVGAHLAWAATFNGEQDVYYLRIGDYDCNDNGIGDSIDIATGSAPDTNNDGIPDVCDPPYTSDVAVAPSTGRLLQNYPNPFNPGTTIAFEVPEGHTRVRVFDLSGRLVRTLVDAELPAGPGRASWDGTDVRGASVGSGIYLYRLEAGGATHTRKMLLLR